MGHFLRCPWGKVARMLGLRELVAEAGEGCRAGEREAARLGLLSGRVFYRQSDFCALLSDTPAHCVGMRTLQGQSPPTARALSTSYAIPQNEGISTLSG